MKRILLVAAMGAAIAFTLGSCGNKDGKTEEAPKQDSTSVEQSEVTTAQFNEAVGIQLGTAFRTQGVELDLDSYTKGLKDAYADKAGMDEQKVGEIIQKYMTQLQAKKAEKELAKSKKFLDSVAQLAGVQRDESGLLYQITEEGAGAQPTDTSWVKIDYVGKLTNGEEFDSSISRGKPAILSLNGVVRGWQIGIPKIKEGGKATLYIPADLGYGEMGRQPIPGNAVMIFDVDLIHVLTHEEVTAYKAGQYE